MLEISDLTVKYRTEDSSRVAIDCLSLVIPGHGYTLGLVGESGSGKTTLGMSILNALEPPGQIVSGRIEYQGKNIIQMTEHELRNYRWRETSMVYQSAMNSLNPVKTIAEHIEEVFKEHSKLSSREIRERTLDLLESVGIEEERADDYPHEFSGGMRQRAVIAMALALSPKLLIADEPTSALDVVVQKQILAMLRDRVKDQKLSLIFITHEIAILNDLVDNVAVMFQGEIVEEGPIDKVLLDPLHPYSEMLLTSLLTLDSTRESIIQMQGSLVDKSFFYQMGCKYAGTCKYAFEKCKAEKPKLREIEDGRKVACHKY